MFFNRPEVTRRVIDQIRRAKPPVLFLVQDGPRLSHPGDEALVESTRAVAETIAWDCTIHRIYAKENLGVRKRFMTALDEVFATVDRAIILEDDCYPDSSFFAFSDEILERFANEPRVGMVSGNNFLRGKRVSDDSYFFTPDVRIWGWGTWARVWREFSAAEEKRVWEKAELDRAISRLDSSPRRAAMRRMSGMLRALDTWDVSFVLHCLDRGYLNVAPAVNLVRNIGFGADSTHTAFHSFADDVPAEAITFPLRHPRAIESNPRAGHVEASVHRALWWRFPLLHPIEFSKRVLAYLGQLNSRRG
jgi:hypothetical protein